MKTGIIGCGAISKIHIDALLKTDEIEKIVFCDKIEKYAKTYANIYKSNYYTNYKEMIDKENIDAVHILTPHYLHSQMARYKMEKGIHVLV